MNLKCSFVGIDNFKCRKALVQMYIINESIKKNIIVSDELLDRFEEVKNRLVNFSKDISHKVVNSLWDLNNKSNFRYFQEPLWEWNYHLLDKPIYLNKYAVSLTETDRLIMDLIEEDNEIIIIEELMHYHMELKRKDLKGVELELYDLLGKFTLTNFPSYNELTDSLFKLSKLRKFTSDIWIFD